MNEKGFVSILNLFVNWFIFKGIPRHVGKFIQYMELKRMEVKVIQHMSCRWQYHQMENTW